MNRLRITMAQIDFVVGRIEGNRDRMIEILEVARDQQVDLVIFPELSLSGYPPKIFFFEKIFWIALISRLTR